MPQRVIISCRQGTDAAQLDELLRTAGASSVEPVTGIPDTLLALVDEPRAEAFIERVRHLDGVRHVERDSLRYSS